MELSFHLWSPHHAGSLLAGPGPSRGSSSCSRRHQGLAVPLFNGHWTLFFPDRNELFSAQRGARKDASKILIVITDGQKKGDPLGYQDVIPMAEAAGIIRYAVGVGCGNALPRLPLKATSFSRTETPSPPCSLSFYYIQDENCFSLGTLISFPKLLAVF